MKKLSGFVNIIKPTGMTSSDVVCRIKRILNTKKVGHLGTLDPAASGVLPIAIGKGTKFFDYFLSKDKEYFAIVQFGYSSDTLDSFGNVVEENQEKNICEEDIENVLSEFVGEIEQIPPKYSAIKINGKKACELARENVNFEIKPRKINIFSVKLLKKIKKNTFLFKVHCSAGTYIRTLFFDIAKRLDTVSITPVIIRTKSGLFDLKNAITLDELENKKEILSVQDTFFDKKTIFVNEFIAKKLINGVKIDENLIDFGENFDKNENFFIKFEDEFIGYYKIEKNIILPIVYLYEKI